MTRQISRKHPKSHTVPRQIVSANTRSLPDAIRMAAEHAVSTRTPKHGLMDFLRYVAAQYPKMYVTLLTCIIKHEIAVQKSKGVKVCT